MDSRVAPKTGPTMGGGAFSGVKKTIPDASRPHVQEVRGTRPDSVAGMGDVAGESVSELRDSPAPLAKTTIPTRQESSRDFSPAHSETVLKDGPAGQDAGAGGVLKNAGKEISATSKAGGGEIEMHRSLKQVFDASRREPSGALDNVTGGFQSAQDKIAQTVGIANISSPHSAPRLYRSAIESASESFPAELAREVTKSVLGSARRKAETALPQLAKEAYQAAETSEPAALDKSLSSFDSWESLLGSPNKPLVENMGHLRSDMRRVLEGSSAGRGSIQPSVTNVEPLESGDRTSEEIPPSASATRSSPRDNSTPEVWFKRNESGSFTAMLAPSAVAPVRLDLKTRFALNQTAVPLTGEEEMIRKFSADPSARNGARLLYGYYRGAGASFWRSAAAGALYWARHTGESLRQSLRWSRSRGPRADAMAPGGWMKEFAAAENALTFEAIPTLRQARAAFIPAQNLASDFEKLTGDDSPARAIAALSQRIESGARTGALEPHEPLPEEFSRLLGTGREFSVRSWIEKMRSELASRGMVFHARSSQGPQWRVSVAPSLYALQIDRVLAEMKTRAGLARRMAVLAGSQETSAARYLTIGRTKDYTVQTFTRVLPDERRLLFTVLRDRDLGQLAFARADWLGPTGQLRPALLSEVSLP